MIARLFTALLLAAAPAAFAQTEIARTVHNLTPDGPGTMKETAAPGTVPITVTGTFQRPQLSLTISGMTFEGRAVEGTFQGSYTTVGGISAPLRLSATGYSKDVTILLQER